MKDYNEIKKALGIMEADVAKMAGYKSKMSWSTTTHAKRENVKNTIIAIYNMTVKSMQKRYDVISNDFKKLRTRSKQNGNIHVLIKDLHNGDVFIAKIENNERLKTIIDIEDYINEWYYKNRQTTFIKSIDLSPYIPPRVIYDNGEFLQTKKTEPYKKYGFVEQSDFSKGAKFIF